MSGREAFIIRLFVAKQELRFLLEGSEDARKSAHATDTEFSPEVYLMLARDLDALAAQKRVEIAELESQLHEVA